MSIFGTPSTPAAPSTGFGSFTPQTPASTGSMFGGGNLFGSTPTTSVFGTPNPGFGSSTPTPGFGSSTPTPGFGSSTPTPGFGSSTPTPGFGSSTPTPGFGSSNQSPGFGTPTLSTPGFGNTTPGFGTPATPGFGTPNFGGNTPAFGSSTPAAPTPGFGNTPLFGTTGSSSLFGSTPFGQAQAPGSLFQSQPSLFGTPNQSSLFGQTPQQQSPFQPQPMFSGQLTTQMAPVAPLATPLLERELQAIVDAYKEDVNNPGYAFKHLLFSVMDPSQRHKPTGVTDIMWAEAMSKLEAMDTKDRERLFPELLLGFKDLSRRLQLQDEAIASDNNRLQGTESNVKLLQRHFQVVTQPWLNRLRLKEQELHRRLLKLTRITEMLEAKGLRMSLTRSETFLGEKLRSLARQLQPSTELPRRVDSVLSVSRLRAGVANTPLLPGQLDEQSLNDIQEVLRKQTEAVSRLANVLKRDLRDMEIMTEDNNRFLGVEVARSKSSGSPFDSEHLAYNRGNNPMFNRQTTIH